MSDKLRFKKLHEDAKLPQRSNQGDAGFDLYATEVQVGLDVIKYKFGIAVEIPKQTVGLLFPRSSVYKTDLFLANCVGVIDSGYRGEIMSNFKRTINTAGEAKELRIYSEGERAAQLVVVPLVTFYGSEFVEELSSSDRGESGFGSTGR